VAWALGGLTSPWAALAVPAAFLDALAFAATLIAFSARQQSDLVFVTWCGEGSLRRSVR
jgi:hypothetical protein